MTDGQRPRHTRRDANQPDIVDDLCRLGFYVLDLADIGGRVLDLFVCGHVSGGKWQWLAVEIKTPTGKLTVNQERFFEEWPDVPAIVAQTTEDVLRWYARAAQRERAQTLRRTNKRVHLNGATKEI